MKHYGDITKMNGAEIEPVEVIVGGSPCQDLSVAGRRKGLAGERSGLFIEQIRIIKEMRKHDRERHGSDEHFRPRPYYMLWENVPGALSSGKPKGEDFRIVLEETARIVEESAVIPEPPKGKWSNSGAIVGNGWSIAWTVRNARFYGVPQRRRRIALVASFGDESAPEILFESEGMQGNFEPSGEAKQGFTRHAEKGIDLSGGRAELQKDTSLHAQGMGEEIISFQERAGKAGGGKGILIQPDHVGAMRSENVQNIVTPFGFKECDDMYTLNATEVHAVCAPMNWDGSQTSPTLTANNAGRSQRMPDKDNFNCVLQPIAKPIAYIDGWGGNMEKMFVDDALNTVRASQPQAIILDDQGGAQMSIYADSIGTLRAQTHGHIPTLVKKND